jgi:hypothetical protein
MSAIYRISVNSTSSARTSFHGYLSRICCLRFFHWLWRFNSLSDIWCPNRESWLTIPRSSAHEFMAHPILHDSGRPPLSYEETDSKETTRRSQAH